MAFVDSAKVLAIAQRFGNDRGRLMDIARAVRAEIGNLDEEVIGLLAGALGVHRVEVRDMVSFYHFLPRESQGRVTVHLCNALVERLMGADEVAAAFEKATGVKFGETTPDGAITLGYVPCIGLSDQAPSALIGDVPFTNLKPEDVPEIVAGLRKGTHPSQLPKARVEANLRQAGPVVFAHRERGAGLRRALEKKPEEVVAEVTASGLRGAGGAGFPTGKKWEFCRKFEAADRVVVCNADEGEPGTFKDRVILRDRADVVFEGLAVAGYAIGASHGYLYLRHEYEYMRPQLEEVLQKMRADGLLGRNILGQGFDFDIRIQMGAGAYVCGEETSLLESMEGKRGAPRERPPYPVEKGYLNLPTAVNNVETLACVARILEKGAGWFSAMGTQGSKGCKLVSVSGDCERPGVYEIEYGTTIRALLEMVGGQKAQAVQMAGPAGQCLSPADFDRKIAMEDVPTGGSVVVLGPQRDLLWCMRELTKFFVEESCGWCTPCRVGTVLLDRDLGRILEGKATAKDLERVRDVARTVKLASRCGLGTTAPNPVTTSLEKFPELYKARLREEDGSNPNFDLAQAMRPGLEAAGRTMEGVTA